MIYRRRDYGRTILKNGITLDNRNVVPYVATYPSTRVQKGQNRWAKVFVSNGENERNRHQHLFEENVRKTKKR